jgi:hypothetical protein
MNDRATETGSSEQAMVAPTGDTDCISHSVSAVTEATAMDAANDQSNPVEAADDPAPDAANGRAGPDRATTAGTDDDTAMDTADNQSGPAETAANDPNIAASAGVVNEDAANDPTRAIAADSANKDARAGHNAENPFEMEDSDEGSDDERAPLPSYICEILGYDNRDLWEDACSEYSGDGLNDNNINENDITSRGLRGSRDNNRLERQQDYHVGATTRILECMIVQVQNRDDGEPDKPVQGASDEEFFKSELKATSATIGILEWLRKRIHNHRKMLSRSRRQLKEKRH